MPKKIIRIKGARHNNLKNLNIDLPLNELIVVTGVSGSGKSSLAFDTVYAEGQRRYVETFSPYARQFLDRMDKPAVDRVEGIPPSIAIDQTNPVRTSRSTVGTMTELNDHLKLLFARAAQLYCRGCGERIRRDTPDSVVDILFESFKNNPRIIITFAVEIPENFSQTEIQGFLEKQGYIRIHSHDGQQLEVVQDRVRLSPENRDRIIEALEAAFHVGRGRVNVYPLTENKQIGVAKRFSADLHCAECDIHYQDPTPNAFSFNSPVGACESCRGFGRTMGIDYDLVIPDENKTLADGAVKPWQTESYIECQADMMRFAKNRGVPTDTPWKTLDQEHKQWVIEGEGEWEDGYWYGAQRFFDWLETKSYKMHIRVLLSRYRAYNVCSSCGGARLKNEPLLWRVGTNQDADQVLSPKERFRPRGLEISDRKLRRLPGLTLHDVVQLPLERTRSFFSSLHLPAPLDEATDLLLDEIRTRLDYLVDVGLGYLTLDRQSRTLSGGEVQRINLTTALGTSLVNTLFVLDEPSIGLHPRDMQRVIGVLHRLRDAGNSLLVVEHDPQVMFAADRILDMGPGPGERGGEAIFFGTPKQLLRRTRSLTAQYLSGRRSVSGLSKQQGLGNTKWDTQTKWIEVSGAQEHNLKKIDVRLPLNRLVCVTGVSGSGKSTLIQDILYNGVSKLKGKPKDPAGRHRAIKGLEHIREAVLIDQSPIGKTTRSNPASYVGAFEAIRKVYASEPLSFDRGYTAGTFSFNSGNGRCPSCGGNGFEHVEMQFLSDVYLRCSDCNGTRYRSEVLEVKRLPPGDGPACSIADVLDMTITEAIGFFAEHQDVLRGLEPLQAVGLGYLKLGQPVPTLSGGEAQRLKLAGHLAKHTTTAETTGTLFLFDEPTTGLHFEDIAKLLNSLQRLIAQGHSAVVIEHNLDVMLASDWIIDLGPEGGERGGEIVCVGTPQDVMKETGSHTGAAMNEYQQALRVLPVTNEKLPSKITSSEVDDIQIVHAREHNLKNIDVTVPRDKFTVITGISGSGKSTVAFDILFNEGQRRYLESLNAYARQFVQPSSRPDVDAIFGIPPTVAIKQRTSRGGRKSTVATMTEIYHFLRLLFVKLGTQYCPNCEIPIEPQTLDEIVARLMKQHRGRSIRLFAPLVTARKGYYTDLAKWAYRKGYEQLRVDGELTPTDPWPRLDRFKEHDIDLPFPRVQVTPRAEPELRDLVRRALDIGKGLIRVNVNNVRRNKEQLFSVERACPSCGQSFEAPDPRLFSYNSKRGWCETCFGTGVTVDTDDQSRRDETLDWVESGEQIHTCPACQGERLKPEALAVRFHKHNIAEFNSMTVDQAAKTFGQLHLKGREADIARDLLPEIRGRLEFLKEVGLSYLTLERAAPTLSGGEAQRIRLASQLGSNLRGVCYILDEPTIGLHPRDNRMLLDTLKKLQEKGNTVIVVEHDEDTIRRAEHLIDIGPRAGVNGGEVIAQGSLKQLLKNRDSLTAQMLANPLRHPLVERRKTVLKRHTTIDIQGASLNNLRNIDVSIPLGRMVCVTGVSGSGKSTLVRNVLHENLKQLTNRRRRSRPQLKGCAAIEGVEYIERVLEVDQTPIGKTPRSCPATYVGIFDHIRKIFAQATEARLRGYTASRFSFNSKGGRCEACDGQGVQRIEMSFLPNVEVNCDTCRGARYNAETLMVEYKGKNVGDVLSMSVDQAVEFFSAYSAVYRALKLLQDVGLGYLTLGQPSPTLSGGEAQRIKLVSELAKAKSLSAKKSKKGSQYGTLYILDEPTVGLHMADVDKLIHVLHRLVDAGNSVIVIEHNLDVMGEADWIIDLGPEGGAAGGRVVAQGAPEQIVSRKRQTLTGKILGEFLVSRATSL